MNPVMEIYSIGQQIPLEVLMDLDKHWQVIPNEARKTSTVKNVATGSCEEA